MSISIPSSWVNANVVISQGNDSELLEHLNRELDDQCQPRSSDNKQGVSEGKNHVFSLGSRPNLIVKLGKDNEGLHNIPFPVDSEKLNVLRVGTALDIERSIQSRGFTHLQVPRTRLYARDIGEDDTGELRTRYAVVQDRVEGLESRIVSETKETPAASPFLPPTITRGRTDAVTREQLSEMILLNRDVSHIDWRPENIQRIQGTGRLALTGLKPRFEAILPTSQFIKTLFISTLLNPAALLVNKDNFTFSNLIKLAMYNVAEEDMDLVDQEVRRLCGIILAKSAFVLILEQLAYNKWVRSAQLPPIASVVVKIWMFFQYFNTLSSAICILLPSNTRHFNIITHTSLTQYFRRELPGIPQRQEGV